jgi:hypothetical protein
VAAAHDRLQERLDEAAALRLVPAEREDLLELVHDQRQASERRGRVAQDPLDRDAQRPRVLAQVAGERDRRQTLEHRDPDGQLLDRV